MYILAEPDSLKIRYIGITREKYLSKRLSGHKWDSINRNGKTYHHHWIRKIYNSGKKPIIRKIALFNSWEEARKVEIELIKRYKKSHNLTNSYDEGKFQSTGKKSARVYFTKPIYLYDDKGVFVKEYKSSKLLCKDLNIKEITVEKILRRKGRAKNGMKYHFQLSRIKVDKMLPLLNTSNRYQSQYTSPLVK